MQQKKTAYRIAIAFIGAMVSFFATAQKPIECEKVAASIAKLEAKTAKISTTDPDLISLHYLIVDDIRKELNDFRQANMPQLHLCTEIDFYATKRRCDTLDKRLQLLKDSLSIQRKRVDTLFFTKSIDELHHQDTAMAEYFLDRCLQYNRLEADALILKAKILFNRNDYDESIDVIHLLYNEAPLTREQENELSDFTALFYGRLFTMGDSLVKMGLAAEALEIFQSLETFCHDMPSSYCNDDYYHGIIRSKSGVYESYLTIAQVAWKKKNYDIAYKFLDYAQAYRSENPDEVEISSKYANFIVTMENERWHYAPEEPIPEDDETEKESVQNNLSAAPDTTSPSENQIIINGSKVPGEMEKTIEPISPHVIDKDKELEYARLLNDALFYWYNGNYSRSVQKLEEAMAVEACNCVTPDARIRLIYEDLKSARKGRKK